MTAGFDMALSLARQGRWPELNELLDSMPNLATEQDGNGATLLVHLAYFPGSAEVLRKLLSLGADPNHRAFNNSNALAAAIVGGSTYGLTTLPELKVLLDGGADPNVVADAGMPALHWAISQNRLEHARVLLQHGADTSILTSDTPPESPREIASRMGSSGALTLLDNWKARDQISP